MSDNALAKLSMATQALAEAKTLDEVKHIRDLALAAQVYAKAAHLGLEAQNHAAEIKLRAERKAGEMLAQLERGTSGKYGLLEGRAASHVPLVNHTEYAAVLEETNTSRFDANRWQQIATLPEPVFEQHIAETISARRELTASGALQLAKTWQRPDWYQSSESDDWWTPQWLFDLLHSEFVFDTDVCASDANHKCPKYYTREQDGLSREWVGSCWMNPPYGRSSGDAPIGRWIEKAYESALSGATVTCLVPARTDTSWWWEFCIRGEVRFLPGRLRFSDADNGATFPSAVVIFHSGVPDRCARVVWWRVSEANCAR